MSIAFSDSYRTLQKPSEGLYKEKGSKFIGLAYPVDNEEEAKEILQSLRIEHPKAVHVCFAWRFGIGDYRDRFSDDGEPNNSAGRPIFGQILAAELSNTLVAVVRYYGGTKLGVGGLISAYKIAAKEAIENGEIIEKYQQTRANVSFNPGDTGQVMSLLNQKNCEIISHGFEGQLHMITFKFRSSSEDEIIATFAASPKFNLNIDK